MRYTESVKLGLSAVFAYLLGGFDPLLQLMCIAMLIDFLTGLILGGVFHKSTKTKSGTLNSKSLLKGAFKKVCQILLVIMITRLGATIGDGYFCRNTALLFFITNECISILENMGKMGVKYPKWLKSSLEVLKNTSENTDFTKK